MILRHTLINTLTRSVFKSSARAIATSQIMTAAQQASPSNGFQEATSSSRFHKPAHRIAEEYERGPDVWSVFNPMNFPNAVNLGQGFMNFAPPAYVRDAFSKIASERVDVHHYSHPKGRPRLRKAVVDYIGDQFKKPIDSKDISPAPGKAPQMRTTSERIDIETEIVITSGANGGMYSALAAFLEPGDEVIFLEPYFDQYEMEVKFNQGVPVHVPLIPPPASSSHKNANASEWKIDFDLLKTKMGSGKVKAILLNTPHNPIGKVFDLEELQKLASLCIEHDLLVISDEVYDCLTFDGKPHLRIASLEGMWERTLTVGSAGKSLACTGWRIGWLVGPEHLVKPTLVTHIRINFCTNSTAAEAAAIGLEEAPAHDFFATQVKQYAERRDKLMSALDSIGMPYTIPQGAYFILADASSLEIPDDFEYTPFVAKQRKDFKMAYFLAKTCDVVCIPVTAFTSSANAHLYENYLRFAFCKDNEIDEAAKRLQKLKPYLKK